MILKFFLNRFNFFDLLEEQVGHAVAAASFFQEVTAQDHVTEEMLSQMAQIEHEGDNAAHRIIQRLNRTFLTPFDRQDIHALAMEWLNRPALLEEKPMANSQMAGTPNRRPVVR